MNKRNRTSREKNNTSNQNFNANIPQLSKAIISKEEYTGMGKCRRKSNAEIKNEEVKGKMSSVEEIKILKCSRKGHVDIINE